MSSNLETLQKQISSGEDLSSIVRTMKALAATSVRQYEKAAGSLDDYYRTVELGLSVALPARSDTAAAPPRGGSRPPLLLVFGSDHGLAGRFNEQIVAYALENYWLEKGGNGEGGAAPPPGAVIISAGEQVSARVRAAGIGPAAAFNMPTSIEAITPFVQLLLERIEGQRAAGSVEEVTLFYNRPHGGGFSSQAETMLPVDFDRLRRARLEWESRSLPTYTMPAHRLLAALLGQYFFVTLYRACALSLAAENVSRLAAMQAAEKNIDERMNELRAAYRQERQAAITEELLDIVSGFRAVRGS